MISAVPGEAAGVCKYDCAFPSSFGATSYTFLSTANTGHALQGVLSKSGHRYEQEPLQLVFTLDPD